MKRWTGGKTSILLLIVIFIGGGLAACQKTTKFKFPMIKITEPPLRLGAFVRETTPESSAFRVEMTNVSAAPVKYMTGAIVFLTEDGLVISTQPAFYNGSSSIPPGGKAEMRIPITNEKIHSAKLIIKEVLYEAGILLNEPNGTMYGKWVNEKYDAELGAAKNYPPRQK